MSTTTTNASEEQRVTQVVNVALGGGRTARLVITIHMTSTQAPVPASAAHQQQQLPRLVIRGPTEDPVQQHQPNQPAQPQQHQQNRSVAVVQPRQQNRPVAVVQPRQQSGDARPVQHRPVGQRLGAPLVDALLGSNRRRRLCSADHHRNFCPRCHIRRRQVCRWWIRQQYRQL